MKPHNIIPANITRHTVYNVYVCITHFEPVLHVADGGVLVLFYLPRFLVSSTVVTSIPSLLHPSSIVVTSIPSLPCPFSKKMSACFLSLHTLYPLP